MMKLATYQDGSRDGQLVVVSRDLASAHYATGITSRMQAALDDWNYLSPQLQELSEALDSGRARHAFAFDAARCMAPLPRAFCHAEGGGYPHHEALAEAGGDLDGKPGRPHMRRLSGGGLQGAQDAMVLGSADLDCDFQAGLAAITGDIPAGCPPEQALEGVRLLALANGWVLRRLVAHGMALQARPWTAFSPVAATPDELGPAWSGGRLEGRLQTTWNGRKVGLCDTGADMDCDFSQLIAHLAQTAGLPAGTLCGSGPVSNRAGREEASGPAKETRRSRKAVPEGGATPEWPRGHGCVADRRAMEIRLDGMATTGFVQSNDTVRIEMKGRDGQSIFGAIEQEVVVAERLRSQARLAY